MNPHVLLVDANTYTAPYPAFPLGVAHVAAALSARGYDTTLFSMAMSPERLEAAVRETAPDFVGVSLRNIDNILMADSVSCVPALVDVVRRVRALSDVPVILGGSGYSLFPDRLLDVAGADFGIAGEGEVSFPALLERLRSGQSPRDVPGLVHRWGDRVVVNERQLLDADLILTPSMPEAVASFYIETSSMLNVQTQRGCACKCTYCTYPVIEGAACRRRDPASVFEDLEAARAVGARYVFIVDSVFNGSRAHVTAMCEEIIRRDIRIEWGCFLRPRNIDQPLMGLMARAGLRHIEFGTDSLCDAMLASYHKGLCFSDIVNASECARKAGVHYAHFLVIGGPGESEATFRETLENSRYITSTVFFPAIGVRLYPNTTLYEQALAEGVVSPGDDLLEPRFYMSPALPPDRVMPIIAGYGTEMSRWAAGELTPDPALMRRLRLKGHRGPLWEYMSS